MLNICGKISSILAQFYKEYFLWVSVNNLPLVAAVIYATGLPQLPVTTQLSSTRPCVKGTGAKRNVCPGSCVSTEAKFPVESAPMSVARGVICWRRLTELFPSDTPGCDRTG